MAATRKTLTAPRPLDDPSYYLTADPSAMRERLAGMGEQCREAYSRVRGLARNIPVHGSYRTVIVAGMGGSAVGGDLLAGLVESRGATAPVSTWRDYGLPSWAGADTLVLVSSYSGETEEALSAFRCATDRGCSVVTLTSGGTLRGMAHAQGVPVLDIPYRGEPRNALGYSLLGPLALLERTGVVPEEAGEVEEAASLLRALGAQYGVERPAGENPAKDLALRTKGRLPVVYAAGHLSAVARRWKTDFNENSKCWAFAETLPELNHNTVNGYGLPLLQPSSSLVIFLRSGLLPRRTLRRYEVTAELLEDAGAGHTVVEAQGEGTLAQILSLVYLGSWTSYYLGLLYGVDPSPVPGNDYLKARMNDAEAPLPIG